VYTNLDIIKWEETTEATWTHHKLFKIRLGFKKSKDDIDIRSMPTRITAVDHKNEAASENTIKDMLSEGYSIQQQAKDLYLERVKKRKIISQWYI
jgi:hypothetical protein